MGREKYWSFYAMDWPNVFYFRYHNLCADVVRFAANNVEAQSLFQSGWFIEGLLADTGCAYAKDAENTVYPKSGDVAGIIDDRLDYGDRHLYSILTSGRDGWTGAAAAELLPVVGGDIIELLSGGARHEALLYQTLWPVVLIMFEDRPDESLTR